MRSFVVGWLRRLGWLCLLLAAAAAGLAGWQRETLLGWYAARGLLNADEASRDAWVERVATHEREALPRVLSGLRREGRACTNVRACVLQLSQGWQPDDPRRLATAQQLARDFGVFSPEGQRTAIELSESLSQSVPARLAPALAVMVLKAAHAADAQVHDRALTLAVHLADKRPAAPAAVQACRELTRVCLREAAPETRGRALRLALQPGIDLRDQVVPLLHDPSPEIRRAAMIVLGPETTVIATDDLLRWLHDPDPDVRRLCEGALKGRGLQDEHLKIGRLMTDDRYSERLKVLDALRATTDLDPAVWLRRLSHDPERAIRAAAIRLAMEQPTADLLADRLEQMSQDDPSPTIRQLARYYLACRKSE